MNVSLCPVEFVNTLALAKTVISICGESEKAEGLQYIGSLIEKALAASSGWPMNCCIADVQNHNAI